MGRLTSSRCSYPQSVVGTVWLLGQNVCRPGPVPDMESSISPKGGEEGVKDLLLTIGLDLGALFVILGTISVTGEMAFQQRPHTLTLLYAVKCGSVKRGDRYDFAPSNDHYRRGPYLPGLSGRIALAK